MPHLIKALSEQIISVFILRPCKNLENSVYRNQDFAITYGSVSNFVTFLKLFRYGLKHRNDIFHVYNLGPLFLIALQLAGVKKIVYSIRGTIYWKTKLQKNIRKPLWKLALIRNCIFIANSGYSRDCFMNAVGYKEDIEIVYNPIASPKFNVKNERHEKNNKLQIIYSGRLVKGKNLFLWLDCAKAINNDFPKTVFKLQGNGPLKNELIEYSKVIGLSDKVLEFAGHCTDIEVAYQQADLLLFLSEYESFGNVVVESILCGTPVLASNISSMKEIFKNFPDFIIDDMDDPIPVIGSRISNIEQLKILALRAREEFKDRFSLEQHVEKLRRIYQSF
jgi:glycosyltransferase involved in cell wall biosynthesis